MSSRVRAFMLAAGAAALLSGQAMAATSAPRLDPLVSLSVFGTVQSRAAVCAGALAAGAAAAVQAPAPGCVLPVTAPPPLPPPPVTEPIPPPPPPPAGGGIGIWPLLLGLAAIVGVAALILSSDDGDGDLEPISP